MPAPFLAILFAALCGMQAQAQSRPQCNDRQAVLDRLAQKYKETPVASGVTSNGGLVEVLTDAKGGSWTIIVTTPQGVSCLVAAGEGWRKSARNPVEPRI